MNQLEYAIGDNVYEAFDAIQDDFFIYKDSQNIIIPIEEKYMEKALEFVLENTQHDFPDLLKDLLLALRNFLILIQKETDFFLTRRFIRSVFGVQHYAVFHLIVHVFETVQVNNNAVSFQTIHESREHEELLRSGYYYRPELFHCLQIKNRKAFRYILTSLSTESMIMTQGSNGGKWPFYGWSR